MVTDAAGVTVVWWQVGVCVCQGGDWAMPAAGAGAWSPLASGHPESQLLPVSPGQALPLPALSHNTFISRPSSSSPQHTTSVISTSSPTSQAHSPPDLGYQGQKDCGVQVILVVSKYSFL